jgi:hypothetical protein
MVTIAPAEKPIIPIRSGDNFQEAARANQLDGLSCIRRSERANFCDPSVRAGDGLYGFWPFHGTKFETCLRNAIHKGKKPMLEFLIVGGRWHESIFEDECSHSSLCQPPCQFGALAGP